MVLNDPPPQIFIDSEAAGWSIFGLGMATIIMFPSLPPDLLPNTYLTNSDASEPTSIFSTSGWDDLRSFIAPES